MSGGHGKEIALVWLALVAISMISVLIVEGAASPLVASTAAVLLAAVKAHFVVSHFMEVKRQHKPLRLILSAWTAVVSAGILAVVWS